MSKFTIKVELQGLKIEVEGTKEDAPRIAQKIGQQLSGLLAPAAMLAPGNGNSGESVLLAGETETDSANGGGKKRKPRKGASGGRTPAETINLTHNSATFGSPQQGWTTAQKAIWFLYIVSKQADITQITAHNIAKNFNRYFRAAGIIHGGNVGQGLEKEKVKGPNATVGADMSDGTAKYFLTQAGTILAERLAKGEAVTAE